MAIKSVNNAFAVLLGRRSGNPEEESKFLESLDPRALRAQNSSEQRARVRKRKRRLGLGDPPRRKALGES